MKEDFSIVRLLISLVILGAGIGGFLLMGAPEVAKRPPARKSARVVQTVVVPKHDKGIQFEVDGVVVPYRQIDIAAEVSGRIDYKAPECRLGNTVTEEQLLFRIDQSDYKLEIKRLTEEVNQADTLMKELKAEIDTIDNQIASAQSQLDIDERQVERAKAMVDRRAGSESELDTWRRTALTTKTSMQKMKDDKVMLVQKRERLKSAKALQEANLEKATADLRRTEIRSPMDGVVVSDDVEQEGYVQSGSTLVRIQDTSQLDVTCKLHMRQMNWLWQSNGKGPAAEPQTNDGYDFPKTPAKVIYDLGGVQYQWEGVVNRFDGAGIDNQTRMVPCRIGVTAMTGKPVKEKNEGSNIKPPTLLTGMFVTVRIKATPPIPLVRIPQRAIQPGNAVWTVVDGKLKQKKIRIANSTESHVIAYQETDGLKAGDVVVVSPMATPVEGSLVEDIGSKDPATIKVPGGPPGGRGNGPRGGKPGGPPNGKPSGMKGAKTVTKEGPA